jgi:hypothetical protein
MATPVCHQALEDWPICFVAGQESAAGSSTGIAVDTKKT